jgi:hypothetical protein
VLGRFMARKMWKHWRNSLNASYTRSELLGFLNAVPNHSWKVRSTFLSLTIESQ